MAQLKPLHSAPPCSADTRSPPTVRPLACPTRPTSRPRQRGWRTDGLSKCVDAGMGHVGHEDGRRRDNGTESCRCGRAHVSQTEASFPTLQ